MRYRYLALALLVCTPLWVSAAGFAKQSLFLSKEPATEGDTVLIHAVVANEGADKFAGEVVFKDGEDKLGAVAVTIAPGGANAVSLSWKPLAGSHTVTAQLTDPAGEVVEQESANFTIKEKPQPASEDSSQSAAAVESSQKIQDSIGSYSPAAANATAPVFSALDSLRSQAADKLDEGIGWAKGKTAGKQPGEVLGSATSNPSPAGIMSTLWFIFATLCLYVLTILRFVVGSAGVFYPVFAVLFFYILWRTYKRFRRPSY